MTELDEFEFLVKDNQLAISVDFPVCEISDIKWDTRNTIILSLKDGRQYILSNILPNIRETLSKIKNIMIIFKQGENILEAFDTEIIKEPSLPFNDSFNEEALSFYRAFEELKKGIK